MYVWVSLCVTGTHLSSPAPVLNGNLVSAALLSAIKHVCSKWVKGLPQLTQVPGEIEISFHAIKNTRRKMEDRHALCVDINSLFGLKVNTAPGISLLWYFFPSLPSSLIPSLSSPLPPLKDCPPQSFYGVFDGHVSVEAAEYASIHMLPNLVHHPDFRTNPESALRGAIDLTDKRFCQIVSDRVMLSYGPVDSSPSSLSLSLPRIRRLAPLLWWLY